MQTLIEALPTLCEESVFFSAASGLAVRDVRVEQLLEVLQART